MRLQSLAMLLAAASTPLLAGEAPAGFNGINVVAKPATIGGQPAFVCNVFATFDRPGQDRFLAAAGTPNSPMDIHVVGGTFYQNAFGADTAPSAVLLNVFPSIAFDTFVTIGVKGVGPPPAGQAPAPLTLTPGWPGFQASSLGGQNPAATNMAWTVTPADPNSDPFNPAYVNGNGQVLIGQFTTLNGIGIVGMFRILVTSNGVSTQLNVSFSHFIPGSGALALMGTAGVLGKRRRNRAA